MHSTGGEHVDIDPVDLDAMNLAIEEMRKSVPERREDGKVQPLVGAVIRFPNGEIVAAHRSEFRDGDHAEYTLLERKLPSRSLRGAVLYTTLEPCLKRSPERTACAKRILTSRVEKVWIGIEDPDPTVEGRGRELLLAAGIDVEMFPTGLFRIVKDENAAFIDQALERAADAYRVPPEAVTLSSFEDVEPRVAFENFSSEALEHYRAEAGIEDSIDSPEFLAHLTQMGFLTLGKSGASPTKFGVVLFGKDPAALYPMTTLAAKITHANGKTEPRLFRDPAILLPDRVIEWLRSSLPRTIDRTTASHREIDALPYEPVREGIINAIIHRDYDLEDGAQTHVEVTPETVVVKSVGEPKRPNSLEKLQSLDATPVARNPTLQAAFARANKSEGQGFGMSTFRAQAAAGLPRPTFAFDGLNLALTIYLTPEAAAAALPRDIAAQMNSDERRGWAYLAQREDGEVTRLDYERDMGFSEDKAARHLRHFVTLGLVDARGGRKTRSYRVRR
jgi:ATP-dependent DNA helicase RecG